MTGRRRLAALALLGPLVGSGLVAMASPAYAAGISSPSDGVTFTAQTTVRIRADVSTTNRTELRLKSPTGAEQVVDSGAGTITNNAVSLAYDLDTDCATYPSPSCSGRAPAVNGTWGVRLAGGATDSSTFVLRIPPRAPSSVAARAEGYRAVVISWVKGDEPDLVGWSLYGDGGVIDGDIGLGSCSGTSCSTTVTYASDGTGQHTYELSARRTVSPGSTETLESARSAEVTATLTSPPPPSPSPAPEPATGGTDGSTTGGTTEGGTTGGTSGETTSSTGGTTSSTTGGSTSGSGGTTGSTTAAGSSNGISTSSKPAAAIAQRRAFALTFKAFAPKLGIPKLPPLPATQPAVAAPLPDGTYEKTLGYKEVVTREKVSTPRAAASKVTGAVGSALDNQAFARSLAGALVLLLLAAHLRRWLGSHTEQ